MVIPKIIHYCWLSNDPIPEKYQKCMDSWKEKLQGYEFILWNFERFDIDSSLWVKQAFQAKKYAFAADFIRLYAIYNYGGFYLDTDIEIIKSLDDLLDNDIVLGYESDMNGFEAACLGAEKHHPFLKKCLNYYDNRSFIKPNGDYDVRVLPKIIKEIYNENIDLGIHIYSPDFFSPKNWYTGMINLTENTYSIHHFESGWKDNCEKKDKQERWDFYEKYGKDEYLVEIFKKMKKYENTLAYYEKNPLNLLCKVFIRRIFGEKIMIKAKQLLKSEGR